MSPEATFSFNLTADATVLAGNSHTLTCIGMREENQALGTTLNVEWFDPNGQLITSETTGVNITGVISATSNPTLVSYLMFPSLTTAQAGPYTCRINHTSPDASIMDQSIVRTSVVRIDSK